MFAFVYSDKYLEYNFGPTHPLKPSRTKKLLTLLHSTEFKKLMTVHEPRMASRSEIELFHTSDYVNFVAEMSRIGVGLLDMGDTPAFEGCYEASSTIVGGTLTAVDLALTGKFEFTVNMAGGLHHAHPNRASGFCIFNDPAIAIAYLIDRDFKRIMYLDIDAHHGDGVMYGFYSDERVLDIDIHESGLYLFPGTGFVHEIGDGNGRGLKLNIPLPPYAGDDAFLMAFNEVFHKAVEKFKPEIIIVQCGADGYMGDPLTHLNYSTKTYIEVAKAVKEASQKYCNGRLIILGGGGYNIENTVRVWSLVIATLIGETDIFRRFIDLSQTKSSIEILSTVEKIINELRKTTIIG